ncbi:MAG: polysaccharide lyase [Pseudomonadota bacterium]
MRRALIVLAILIIATAAGAAVFVAASPSPEFADGFDAANISEERWQIDAAERCVMLPDNEHVRDGPRALKIVAPTGKRCEVVPRTRSSALSMFVREPFDEERWYRVSVFVDDLGNPEFSDDLGDNTIVLQWHSSPDRLPQKEGGRGPPLALRIHNNRWGITYGADPNLKSERRIIANKWHFIGPVETGRWIDWTFRVVWSYQDNGLTEVWMDDDMVFQHRGANAYNDFRGVYLKLGIYHPVAKQTIYIDRVSISNGG